MKRGFNKFLPVLAAGCAFFALSACADNRSSVPTPEEAAAPISAPNVDLWLEQMEKGSRELYSARDAVVSALELTASMRVADIGAGTGLHSLLIAEQLRDSGDVFAVDIEPLFLELINQRAADTGLGNITAVLGQDDDIALPDAAVDMVFIADTYHYFADREKILGSIHSALKPGGVLVIVEFDIDPSVPRPEHQAHVKFGKDTVISEVSYKGFTLKGEVPVEGLSENYMLRFVKN